LKIAKIEEGKAVRVLDKIKKLPSLFGSPFTGVTTKAAALVDAL